MVHRNDGKDLRYPRHAKAQRQKIQDPLCLDLLVRHTHQLVLFGDFTLLLRVLCRLSRSGDLVSVVLEFPGDVKRVGSRRIFLRPVGLLQTFILLFARIFGFCLRHCLCLDL